MQPEDINKVTELAQQLLQAPFEKLAFFLAVLALLVVIGIIAIVYKLGPRFVNFLDSLSKSYSTMVENFQKLTAIENQNALTQASVTDAIGGINNNINVLLTEGSVPVKRIDSNVVTAVQQIEVVKDIAIAAADLTNTSQEVILNALMAAVVEIKTAIHKRKTDSQPITTIPTENGEN